MTACRHSAYRNYLLQIVVRAQSSESTLNSQRMIFEV